MARWTSLVGAGRMRGDGNVLVLIIFLSEIIFCIRQRTLVRGVTCLSVVYVALFMCFQHWMSLTVSHL